MEKYYIDLATDYSALTSRIAKAFDNNTERADFLFDNCFLLYAKPIQLVNDAKKKGDSALIEMLGLIEDFSGCLEHRPLTDRILVYQMFLNFLRLEIGPKSGPDLKKVWDQQNTLGLELTRRRISNPRLDFNPFLPYRSLYLKDEVNIDKDDSIADYVKESSLEDTLMGMRPDLMDATQNESFREMEFAE